jgi:hypothetical protein
MGEKNGSSKDDSIDSTAIGDQLDQFIDERIVLNVGGIKVKIIYILSSYLKKISLFSFPAKYKSKINSYFFLSYSMKLIVLL